MDIDLNTILVALMYVTILSMGIGNILITLADIFNHATSSDREGKHVGWIFLLLIVHFNLFWHTKALLDVEDWQFGGFILTIAGPMLMFFATSILLTSPPEKKEAGQGSFFMELHHRFFLMFTILQIWVIGIGYSLVGTFGLSDILNILFAILAVALALNSNVRAQLVGIWVAWGLILTSIGIRLLF